MMDSSVRALEFGPSQAQRRAMPLAVLGVCLFFAGLLLFVKGGAWGIGLGLAFAGLGVWGAYAVSRAMGNARVGADDEAIWFRDGTHRGQGDQRARWEQVAGCVVESRDVDGGAGRPHIVLKDGGGRDLFVLYAKFLSPADTVTLLGFVRARLQGKGADFQVADEWLGGGKGVNHEHGETGSDVGRGGAVGLGVAGWGGGRLQHDEPAEAVVGGGARRGVGGGRGAGP